MDRWNSILRTFRWAFIAIGLISLPATYLAPWDSVGHEENWLHIDQSSDRPRLRSITTLQPSTRKFIGYWATSIVILGIALPIVGFVSRASSVATLIGCPIISFLTVVAACAGMIEHLAPWQYGPPFHDGNGNTYYAMESGFLQGQTLALAQLEDDHWLFRKSKVVVETNGDSPRSWQSMVRPATTNDNGILASQISPDGVLIGFRYDNHAFFAYDFKREIPIGRNGIRDVSPFALLGPTTPLHQPDVERIEKIVQEFDKGYSGVPREIQLKTGLDHPNPDVVALARKLLVIRK